MTAAKKEAVGADGGPIPPAANRFGSSVYGSANCCRTTRLNSIIALQDGASFVRNIAVLIAFNYINAILSFA